MSGHQNEKQRKEAMSCTTTNVTNARPKTEISNDINSVSQTSVILPL